MSKNCIKCVKNERTGPDLLCDSCRPSHPALEVKWRHDNIGPGKSLHTIRDDDDPPSMIVASGMFPPVAEHVVRLHNMTLDRHLRNEDEEDFIGRIVRECCNVLAENGVDPSSDVALTISLRLRCMFSDLEPTPDMTNSVQRAMTRFYKRLSEIQAGEIRIFKEGNLEKLRTVKGM